MTYEQKMERLRELGDMQGEMAQKATRYAATDEPGLASRFRAASYAAMNAQTLMQAALMAERECAFPPVDSVPMRYEECGCCGHYHRPEFNGDCRDDSERFTPYDLDTKHGENGWTPVDLEE